MSKDCQDQLCRHHSPKIDKNVILIKYYQDFDNLRRFDAKFSAIFFRHKNSLHKLFYFLDVCLISKGACGTQLDVGVVGTSLGFDG